MHALQNWRQTSVACHEEPALDNLRQVLISVDFHWSSLREFGRVVRFPQDALRVCLRLRKLYWRAVRAGLQVFGARLEFHGVFY